MTTQLLHNVTAFMEGDQPIRVEHRGGPGASWPIMIKLDGSSSLDIFSDVAAATKLRDELTTAINQAKEEN